MKYILKPIYAILLCIVYTIFKFLVIVIDFVWDFTYDGFEFRLGTSDSNFSPYFDPYKGHYYKFRDKAFYFKSFYHYIFGILSPKHDQGANP